MGNAEFVTRHIGSCQICEGDFKLGADMTMVHHGYTRPGDGYIHGDCCGVNKAPYEVSCEAVKPWLASVEAWVAGRRLDLAKFVAGEVATVTRVEQRRDTDATRGLYRMVDVKVTYTRVGPDHDDFAKWSRVLAAAQANVESDIRRGEQDVARLTKRIANWRQMPIRELTEAFVPGSTVASRTEKDAAKAAKIAARAEKDAKAAALKAKREDNAARRKAMLDEAGATLRAIDTDAPNAMGRALAVLQDLGKKKYASLLGANGVESAPWYWETDLRADDVLVKLGLATTRPSGAMGPLIDYKITAWRA